MLEEKIILREELNSKTSRELCEISNGFKSSVYMSTGSRNVNVKSILGLISLGTIEKGEEVSFRIEGSDSKEALANIKETLGF